MNNLPVQFFNYENNQVRSLKKDDGSIWFVAVDVCKALNLEQVSKAVARLEKDEVTTITLTDSLGRNQETNIINESGLYSLILTSKKKEAKVFKKWITSEVLPSIRKSGSYNSQKQKQMTPAELTLLHAQNILNLETKVSRIETTVTALILDKEEAQRQLKEIEEPKVIPLQKTDRMRVNKVIRLYCNEWKVPYNEAWNQLFEEFNYRYKVNVRQRSENRKISKLDVIELLGKMPELYAIAYDLFIKGKDNDARKQQ